MATRDRTLYLSWITMTQRERENLYVDAFNDKRSRSLFNKMSTSLRIEANKRLRELETHGYDYGKAYNNLVRYLEIEQDMKRVPFLSEVKYDLDELMTINEQVRKFLKSKYSKLEYREKRLRERIEHFDSDEHYKEMWKDWSFKKKKDFLKWLGTEQASFAMDEYGTSDETIIILADAFQEASKKTNGIKVLNQAMDEFNSGDISFNEAMNMVGVSIEKRHSELKKAWHYDKKSKNPFVR